MLNKEQNPVDKLEFGGGSPLTMRHELRRQTRLFLDWSLAPARRMKFDKLEFGGVNDE